MPKRTLFTNITPLPSQVTREVAIAMLHNHDEMIELNPLVIEHHPIKTPRDAPADEFLDCVWQELTDKIHYLPGGAVKGKVSYRACFHDTPVGLQTHIYAPLGLDIREKWSVGGSLPGEAPEARELGLDTPRSGLYLREDCDMKCNMFLTGFVRKNLDGAHKVLVERILKKAERIEAHRETMTAASRTGSLPSSNPQARNSIEPGPASPTGSMFQPGSHMAKSALLQAPYGRTSGFQGQPLSPQMLSPQQDGVIYRNLQQEHPAFRNDAFSSYDQMTAQLQMMNQHQGSRRTSSDPSNGYGQTPTDLPPYQAQNAMQTRYYSNDMSKQRSGSANPPSAQQQQPMTQSQSQPKQFFAELPGSTYHPGSQPISQSHLEVSPPTHHGWGDNRTSMVSELASDNRFSGSGPRSPMFNSDRGSVYSDARNSTGNLPRQGPNDYSHSSSGQVRSDYAQSQSDGERRSISDLQSHANASELPSPGWGKTSFRKNGKAGAGEMEGREPLVTYQGNERIYL